MTSHGNFLALKSGQNPSRELEITACITVMIKSAGQQHSKVCSAQNQQRTQGHSLSCEILEGTVSYAGFWHLQKALTFMQK